MKHRSIVLLIVISVCAASAGRASDTPPLNERARDAIRELKLTIATHGIYAMAAKSGKVLIAIDADKLLNPASNVKMITAAVALKELGGNYRFHTRFTTDRMDRRGTIHNLYIKGNGDPFLVTEVTERMAANLIREGVRRIAGDIVVDESYFKDGTETTWANNQHPYATQTAATALNFNCVRILVDRKPSAGLRAGDKGYEIKLDAPNDYVEIVNKLKPVGRGIRLKRVPGTTSDKVIVSGGLPRRSRHFEKYINITHPALYLGSAFKTLFIENGVPVDGRVREGKAKGTILLADEQSKELRLIVDDMNRFSNNFVAEQLVMHVGAVAFGPPGTTEKGLRLFEKYLSSLGIRKGTYRVVNGSGLSHDNRLTAKQLVAVLKDVYDDTSIREDYISSLSIAGVKGTIKERHKGPLLHGKLKGKTGTLNGVSTLTGYVPMRSGDTAVFAILTNGPVQWTQAHKLQDRIATLMAGSTSR